MKNYAYVTLVTTNHYIPGIIILYESLRRVGSQYPLVCLYSKSISEDNIKQLAALGIKLKLVDEIYFPENIKKYNKRVNPRLADVWATVFTKFNIFELIEYDKIIYCDADIMFLKNCDHCFEMPHMTAALDGEYLHWWPAHPRFNSGFLVVKPETGLKDAILNFILSDKAYAFDQFQVISDQDILNEFYSNWVNQPEKHLNKYYNVFPRQIPKDKVEAFSEDIIQNAYFIHFINKKPWYGEIYDNLVAVSYYTNTQANNICKNCYEYAYGLLLLNKNSDNIVDWKNIETEGLFYYYISLGAAMFYRDLAAAKKYIKLALKISPNNANYQQVFALLESPKTIEEIAIIICKDFLKEYVYSTLDERLKAVNLN